MPGARVFEQAVAICEAALPDRQVPREDLLLLTQMRNSGRKCRQVEFIHHGRVRLLRQAKTSTGGRL